MEKAYEIAQKKKREQNRVYQLVQVIYQICSARGTIHNEICLKKRITWSVLVLNLLRQVFKACTEAKNQRDQLEQAQKLVHVDALELL